MNQSDPFVVGVLAKHNVAASAVEAKSANSRVGKPCFECGETFEAGALRYQCGGKTGGDWVHAMGGCATMVHVKDTVVLSALDGFEQLEYVYVIYGCTAVCVHL